MKRLFAVCAAAAAALSAQAQPWPAKPVRIIIPFVAGGPSDTVGRAIGSKFHEFLGQPAVVENRAGAPTLLSHRRMTAELPIEKVGARLREMMPWIKRNRLVDTSKN